MTEQHVLADGFSKRLTSGFVFRHNLQAHITRPPSSQQTKTHHQLRYDTTEDFNVDSKVECDQLNLAHVARKYKRN